MVDILDLVCLVAFMVDMVDILDLVCLVAFMVDMVDILDLVCLVAFMVDMVDILDLVCLVIIISFIMVPWVSSMLPTRILKVDMKSHMKAPLVTIRYGPVITLLLQMIGQLLYTIGFGPRLLNVSVKIEKKGYPFEFALAE